MRINRHAIVGSVLAFALVLSPAGVAVADTAVPPASPVSEAAPAVDPAPDPEPAPPAPVESTAVEPAPVEPAPVEPAPVEPAPVEPAPVEPAPVEPAPVEPAPVDPAADTGPGPATEVLRSSGEAPGEVKGDEKNEDGTTHDEKDKTAQLKLVKSVMNDDGGKATGKDWTLQARLDGKDWTSFTQDQWVEVSVGAYELRELYGPQGYDLTNLECTDSRKTSVADPVVTLDKGEKVTCTFTNDDKKQPKKGELKLVKKVINNDGGKAVPGDWALQVKVDGEWKTFEQGKFEELPAGTYEVRETDGPAGYDFVSLKCDDDDKSARSWWHDGSTVTVGSGDKVTCTFTNDDKKQPKKGELKLVKKVINNDGGTAVPRDWALQVKVDGEWKTFEQGKFEELPAGTYEVRETDGPAGYDFVSLKCDDDDKSSRASSSGGSTVTVGSGDKVTCTFTNDDKKQPKKGELKLVKKVINNDGGTAVPGDWDLQVRVDGEWETLEQGQFEQLPAGTYEVRETGGPSGYVLVSLTCVDGGHKGDDKGDDDDKSSRASSSGGSTVTVGSGDKVTCTFTNDDKKQPKKGELKLVKKVINNDGGTAVPGDWDLQVRVDGEWETLEQGQFEQLPAGTYEVRETGGPSGYVLVSLTCVDGGHKGDDKGDDDDKSSRASSSGGSTVTVGSGDKVTCTFTNDDKKQPKKGALALVKEVVNDNGGTAVPGDWTLQVRLEGTVPWVTLPQGVSTALAPGTYELRETGGPAGYTWTDLSCANGAVISGTSTTDPVLVLAVGDMWVCTFTNDDPPPPPGVGALALVKEVVNDNGGTAVPGDWTLQVRLEGTVPWVTLPQGVSTALAPGTYELRETGGPAGYTWTDLSCANGAVISGTSTTDPVLVLAVGDMWVCTFTNDDPPPPPGVGALALVKEVVNDNGGTAVPGDWTLQVRLEGTVPWVTLPQGVSTALAPGTYELRETGGPAGYTWTDLSCANGAVISGTSTTDPVLVLAVGDMWVCTFTNDDPPPPPGVGALALVKEVVNDNGGTAVPGDWTLQVRLEGTVPWVTLPQGVSTALAPGTYELRETGGPAGYTWTDLSCANGAVISGTSTTDPVLVLAVGDMWVCTFTNDDPPPPPGPPTPSSLPATGSELPIGLTILAIEILLCGLLLTFGVRRRLESASER